MSAGLMLSFAGMADIGFIPDAAKFGQALLVVGIAMAMPMTGARNLLAALTGLLVSIAVGVWYALNAGPAAWLMVALCAVAAIAGLAGAVARPVPASVRTLFLLVSGLALGASAVPVMGAYPAAISIIVANVVGLVMVFAGLFWIAVLSQGSDKPKWFQIAPRIVSSWVVAIGVLIIALSF